MRSTREPARGSIIALMRYGLVWMIALGCGGGGGGGGGDGGNGTGDGGGGGSTEAATPASAEAPCRTGCAYNVGCEGAELAACTQRCIEEVVPWVRLDALETFTTCMADLACTASEDACLLEVEPLAIHRDWQARCVSDLVPCSTFTEQACAVEPDPTDPNGGQVRFIAPAIVEEMLGCLDATCTDRATCVQSVLLQYNVNLL